MKNKILALLATIGLASSVSAVEINDNISINGFIDGSYQNTNKTTSDTEQLGLDEVEVDFLFNSGAVSGAVHVDTNNGAGNADFDIEQAHFTYALDNGVSFTFGRYGAALGFEREDPAGLYTFSRSYGSSLSDSTENDHLGNPLKGGAQDTSYNLGDVDNAAVEGLTIAYAGDVFSIAVSIEEDGNNVQSDNYDLELSFSYTGMENLVVGGGYFFHNEKGSADERDVLNLHAAYSIGKALVAGEIINASDTEKSAGEDAYMLLVDYDFTDKLGGAIRYSDWETSNTANASKLTIAPNYALTDNLGAILEYSNTNAESNADDEDTIAVELTYTF